MRPDQLQRLQDLSERLADRFLLEADPGEWPGAGKAPTEMTQQERGDGYWAKKNAMATGGVLRFTLDVLAKNAPAEGEEGGDHAKDSDMERQIRDAERRSAKLVEDALARAKRKPEFDKRVSGKG
jgi:hypothetical protein